MKYKLTIIRYEKNENYEAEMAKWKDDQEGYHRNNFRNEPFRNEPQVEIAERSLEVILTEEEYNQVKKGVVETFK